MDFEIVFGREKELLENVRGHHPALIGGYYFYNFMLDKSRFVRGLFDSQELL